MSVIVDGVRQAPGEQRKGEYPRCPLVVSPFRPATPTSPVSRSTSPVSRSTRGCSYAGQVAGQGAVARPGVAPLCRGQAAARKTVSTGAFFSGDPAGRVWTRVGARFPRKVRLYARLLGAVEAIAGGGGGTSRGGRLRSADRAYSQTPFGRVKTRLAGVWDSSPLADRSRSRQEGDGGVSGAQAGRE